MAGRKPLKITYNESHFAHILNQYEGEMYDAAVKGLEYAVKGATRVMRDRVQNSGTAWSGFRPGIGIGREETGTMLESIDYQDRTRKGNIEIIIGYIRDVQKYFWYQEYGFKSWGKWRGRGFRRGGDKPSYYNGPQFEHDVRGIHALKDAETTIYKTAPGLIKLTVGKYLKGGLKL